MLIPVQTRLMSSGMLCSSNEGWLCHRRPSLHFAEKFIEQAAILNEQGGSTWLSSRARFARLTKTTSIDMSGCSKPTSRISNGISSKGVFPKSEPLCVF
jgi:hypothetical protein